MEILLQFNCTLQQPTLCLTNILVVYSLPHILGSHFSIRSQQLDRHVIFHRLYLPRDYRIVNVWFPGTR